MALHRAASLLLVLFLALLARQGLALDIEQAVAAVANPMAQSRSWVADPAGVVRSGRDEINALIAAEAAKSGAEIAVVVLPSIGEFIPREFATALFNHWGVGKKGRDNGVLVLHVLDQRRIEIETGYGLEGALPDVKCHWIVEDIAIPFFKQGSLSDGHYEIVRALIAGIAEPDLDRPALTGHLERIPGSKVDTLPVVAASPEPRVSLSDHPFESSPTRASLIDVHPESPFLYLSILALGAGVLLWLLWFWLGFRFRRRHPDPGDQLVHFREWSWLTFGSVGAVILSMTAWEWQSLTSLWSILAALPGAYLADRHRARQIERLRNLPRLDPETGEPMRRLDEADEDAYLAAGQICEERIGAMDYDVWVSPTGFHRIEQYTGRKQFDVCEQCGYRTYRKIGSRIVHKPTVFTNGLAEDSYACAHCGHAKVEQRTLTRESDNSSHSGGYGGWDYSGGGTFGGGSSGGGGAGGSY